MAPPTWIRPGLSAPSFQAPSGIYPTADPKPAPLFVFQYWLGLAASANSVPPTHVAKPEEQIKFVLRIWFAGGGAKAVSQPAAPESPEETKTDIPSAAACLNSVSQYATPLWPPG